MGRASYWKHWDDELYPTYIISPHPFTYELPQARCVEILFWRQHAGQMSITRPFITLQLSFSHSCLTKSSACFTQIGHNTDHFFTLVIAHAITNKSVGYRKAVSFDDMIYETFTKQILCILHYIEILNTWSTSLNLIFSKS